MSNFDYRPGIRPTSRLITLPSVDTVRRLQEIMSQPPLKLDPFQTHHVTVARSYSSEDDQVLLRTWNTYKESWHSSEFSFESFDYRYYEHEATSKIEGNVASPVVEMARSHLRMTGYPPVYQFLHHAPPLSKAVRSFVVSVADTLVMKEHPFTFEGLYLVSEDDYTENFKRHYITEPWTSAM